METDQLFQKLDLKLDHIRSELDYIKDHMVDRDMFLNSEESQLVEDSYKNEKEGRLISSKNLRKELEK
ncbi:hypothetical protein HYY69_00070 [Candidatus Woesearchaeota archaeon]|nr:hypothetical protein [Candidatus Woesearchaeota archaeon]